MLNRIYSVCVRPSPHPPRKREDRFTESVLALFSYRGGLRVCYPRRARSPHRDANDRRIRTRPSWLFVLDRGAFRSVLEESTLTENGDDRSTRYGWRDRPSLAI